MAPQARTFTTIIDDNNIFSPIIYETKAHNNVALSAHLRQLLCLTSNDPQYIHEDTAVVEFFDNKYVKNEDVMELIMQLNLPAFISIDASLEGTSDTTSVNIVIPDVQPEDVEKEWQHCPAKTILTRIWKLPSQWGTGTTCINMAEALGFIIGDYTIPHNMPVIYITDSDNARTLQRNISRKSQFTHRHLIRQIKQGIDQAIANHLDFLTSQWPHEENLSEQTLEMYRRGEELCQIWANPKAERNNRITNADNDFSDDSERSYDTDEESALSHNDGRRYRFNSSMYDILGHATVVKVYSHQLNEDFSIKDLSKTPAPNMFTVSANQIADNAATFAQRFYSFANLRLPDKLYYPPFSPEWCFSFEGNLINKGASQYFHIKNMTKNYYYAYSTDQNMDYLPEWHNINVYILHTLEMNLFTGI